MSLNGMKPSFTDYNGYQTWIKEWKSLYLICSQDSRKAKMRVKGLQRIAGHGIREACNEAAITSASSAKMMMLRDEAKQHWQNIRSIKRSLDEQYATFPLEIPDAKNILFHFNKKSLDLSFVPMWTLKTKGQSYYVKSITSEIGFTSKERPDHPSTQGMLRWNRGSIQIDRDGHATIR